MSPNAPPLDAASTDSPAAVGRRRVLAAVASTTTLGVLSGCVGDPRDLVTGGGTADLERLEVLNDDQTAHDVTLELRQGDDGGFHREFSLDAKRDDDGKTVVDSESFGAGWTVDRSTYQVAIRLDGDDAWTKQSYDPSVTEVVAVVVEDGDVVIPEGT